MTLDDPTAVGVTVIKRNQGAPFGSNYSLDRAEMMWTFRDGVKTFQVEEIALPSAQFDQYCLNRHLHSERDVNLQSLRHVDGAVKVYLANAYVERFNTRMPSEPKAYRKVKLWRIDGNVDVDRWIDLVTYFFKGNEMLLQYFDPAQFAALVAERERRRAAFLSSRS